jgi:hypothetical protein
MALANTKPEEIPMIKYAVLLRGIILLNVGDRK